MFKTIILEDDILSSWDYEMILDKLGVSVIGTFKSWKQALPKIKDNLPDFMIVDLRLGQNENGLDFLIEMQEYFIPSIVVSGFLKTDLIDHALKNNVVAFVPKPFDKTSFTFHVKKLISELSLKDNNENYLLIRFNKRLIKIPQEEIILIQIDGNYSEINTVSGKKYIIKMSLTKIMKKLNPAKFIRCYRSTVINIDKVESLNLFNDTLALSNKQKLKVGLKYRAQVKKALQGL